MLILPVLQITYYLWFTEGCDLWPLWFHGPNPIPLADKGRGPACPCHSVHQRYQKINMMTNETSSTQLWERGAECTLHLLSTCFCTISNPLGLLKRDPTYKKLNRVIVLLVSVSSCDQRFEKGELEHHSQVVWYENEATNPQETELWGYPHEVEQRMTKTELA